MIPLSIAQLNAIQQVALLLSWILVLFGFFAIAYSIGLLLRNYFQTKSLDYLIFAVLFFFTGLILFLGTYVVQIVPPITEPSDKLMLFVFVIFWGVYTFLIFIHALRLRYEWRVKTTVLWYFILLWLLIYSIAAFFISSLDVISEIIFILSIFVMYTFYFSIGLFLTFSYITVAPVKPTDRIELVRKVYIMFGIMMILTSLKQFVPGSLYLISNNVNYISLAMAIQGLFAIIQGLPVIYICVFYPELLLISHVQLIRAVKLYKMVKKTPTENLEGDKLLVYLNSIPEPFFE